jgi:hypothetical protein
VYLVGVFGWKQIFIDNTFNLALRPLATRRLNVTNLHVKVKGNQCWPADIPDIQDPVNGHWTLDDRDVQFFLKNKRQSLKFHYSLWLWPQQVQATVGHQRSYRCTDVRPHQILNSLVNTWIEI